MLQVDKAFHKYFYGRLKQTFLYVTDECTLRCEQCLYKTTLAQREFPLEKAKEILDLTYQYGARKLTFIGGEPTMYGYRQNNQPLFDLISFANELGYQYVRLDTNGLFRYKMLEVDEFRTLDNLAFSLDGHSESIHDKLRGKGRFVQALGRVRKAIDLGYYVTVTTCVHPGNVYYLKEMIDFAEALGVEELNFHPLFKMGIPRDEFSGNTDIQPEEWVAAYSFLRSESSKARRGMRIRAPQRFVTRGTYYSDPGAYSYCPTRMAERVLFHPNGDVRICALCIGSDTRIARLSKERVIWEEHTSEISAERTNRLPCMSQKRAFGEYVPLCISYKPFQDEYVWRTEEYDKRFVLINEAS